MGAELEPRDPSRKMLLKHKRVKQKFGDFNSRRQKKWSPEPIKEEGL
jgi:hypothetical protein